MTQLNIEKINDNTWMIDIELFGIKRVGALYLIKGDVSCLVDSGTKKEAKGLIRILDSMGAFPPDKLILTHSHWDHTQGVPTLCRKAEARGKHISVMASEKAISNLKDQSWNRVFDEKQQFENIDNVEALTEGQIVDLGGVALETIDFSGHCADDIALYDPKNKTIFIGDALGYKIENKVLFPPFMPPFWHKAGFYAAVEKMRKLEFERICLAHFGCLEGNDAEKFLDETVNAFETWWHIFADADEKGKLEDIAYMKDRLMTEIGIELLDLEIGKASMRFMLSMVNAVKKTFGKKPVNVAEMQLQGIVDWLVKGYKGAAARV